MSWLALILWSYENIFVHIENKNNDFIQQFLLFHVSLQGAFTDAGVGGLM